MTRIKVTVVRTFSPEEVFGQEYRRPDGKIVERCHLSEGESWDTDGFRIPEGFCRWAWEDLRKDRYMLLFGGNIPGADEGTVHVSCSDGKRPVVFKLERVEE